MKLAKIKENAKGVFETIDAIDEIYATEDGQLFTPGNKSAAEDYANRFNGARREKPLKVFTIKRADVLKTGKVEDETEKPVVEQTEKTFAEKKTKK